MFKKFTNGCVRVVNRWLPDAFLFAIILSIIVFVGSMCATKMGPLQVLNAWGDSKGFWGLLSFSMQMALVLVFGSAMAAAKPCKKALRAAAGLCHNNMQAIVVTTFISTLCCWLNWGFGLIAGTLLAKEVVRRVPTVDYPLLIASAYSGFVIWHAGLSGSIPLDLVAGKKFGEVLYQAPITDTVFHPMNLIMVGVILFVMPLVNYAMHPDKAHTVCIDPTLLEDEAERTYEVRTPADKLEHSKLLWAITLVGGFVYIIYYFVQNGFTLGLNIVNMIFLFLGILLHGDLRRYVDAISDAAGGAAGVLLQFPFYAGIMGMMVAANDQGVSLAGVISEFFVSVSNNVTFPMLSFLAAGVVNFFVPSGGGQWAVQGPIMMPAGAAMGIENGRTAMAIAWGDQWTNMIQPFWLCLLWASPSCPPGTSWAIWSSSPCLWAWWPAWASWPGPRGSKRLHKKLAALRAANFFSLYLYSLLCLPKIAQVPQGAAAAVGPSGHAHGPAVKHHPVAEIAGLLRRDAPAQLLLHLHRVPAAVGKAQPPGDADAVGVADVARLTVYVA